MPNPTHLLAGLAVAAATLTLSACGTHTTGSGEPRSGDSTGASHPAGADGGGQAGAANANGGGTARKTSTKGLDPCKALSGKLGGFRLDSPMQSIPDNGERGCRYMFQGAGGPAVTINYWDAKPWQEAVVGGAGAPTTPVTVGGRPAKQTRSAGPGMCDVIVPLGRHSTAEAEARGHDATSKDPVCEWAKDAATEMVAKLHK